MLTRRLALLALQPCFLLDLSLVCLIMTRKEKKEEEERRKAEREETDRLMREYLEKKLKEEESK